MGGGGQEASKGRKNGPYSAVHVRNVSCIQAPVAYHAVVAGLGPRAARTLPATKQYSPPREGQQEGKLWKTHMNSSDAA